MTASSPALRSGPERGAGLALGVIGLVAFAIASGVGLAMGELQALVASITLIACLAVLLDFRIGAVLLIVALPVSGSYLFPHSMFGFTGLNPLNLLIAATLFSFLIRGHLTRFVPKPVLWMYAVPILVAGLIGSRHVQDIHPVFYETLVIHYTDALGYMRDAAIKPLLMVLSALLIGAAVARSKRPESFIAPMIVSVWVMSLVAIGYVLASGISLGMLASAGNREFFSALGMHANDLGRLYAIAYALLLFTWGESKDTVLKTVLVATMSVLTIALILTFSRGAFIGFLLINALYLLWKFNAKTVGIALLVMVIFAMLLPGSVISRLMLGFEGGGDANAVSAGRIEGIWLPLLPELFKSPIWGSGLDSVTWSNAMWSETMLTVTHPHNAYLQAILDMGLVGLVLLLGYFWTVWKGFLSLGSNAFLSPSLRGFYQGAVAGMLCFLVTGMAGSSLRPVEEFTFLWLAIGMMYGQLARRPAGAGAAAGVGAAGLGAGSGALNR